MLQATVGGQTRTYAYDGQRRRVSRTDPSGTTQYLYGNPDDDLQVSNTRDPAGVLTTYYYDDGRRLFALQRGSTRYYVATDQLGSPRVITDTAGALVKFVEYDSFGNITLDDNPGFDLPIGFAGGVADRTTRFVRFGLRDYDPIVGRWTARDPAVFNSGQANLYAYVNNNPVNLIDPVGFASVGFSFCEQGGCVGWKFGYVHGVGISFCVEAGIGAGTSVEIEPFADLAGNGLSVEGKGGIQGGIGKVEVGVVLPVDPCDDIKGKAEACIGPYCQSTDTGVKGKIPLDRNPFGSVGLGWRGKLVAKLCQQAKW